MRDHVCGSLRECASCGALVDCDGSRRPTCEVCRAIARAGRAPAGRVCTAGDCNTVLSVYNRTARCSLHADGIPQLVSSLR
jgi:hypothetical protein